MTLRDIVRDLNDKLYNSVEGYTKKEHTRINDKLDKVDVVNANDYVTRTELRQGAHKNSHKTFESEPEKINHELREQNIALTNNIKNMEEADDHNRIAIDSLNRDNDRLKAQILTLQNRDGNGKVLPHPLHTKTAKVIREKTELVKRIHELEISNTKLLEQQKTNSTLKSENTRLREYYSIYMSPDNKTTTSFINDFGIGLDKLSKENAFLKSELTAEKYNTDVERELKNEYQAERDSLQSVLKRTKGVDFDLVEDLMVAELHNKKISATSKAIHEDYVKVNDENKVLIKNIGKLASKNHNLEGKVSELVDKILEKNLALLDKKSDLMELEQTIATGDPADTSNDLCYKSHFLKKDVRKLHINYGNKRTTWTRKGMWTEI